MGTSMRTAMLPESKVLARSSVRISARGKKIGGVLRLVRRSLRMTEKNGTARSGAA
jgi:hypothetical protein